MKNILFTVILCTLFLGPLTEAAAQTGSDSSSQEFFDTTGFPQWVKDMRRFDIVTFGVFPFSMFLVNLSYGMYLWNDANGMDFSPAGRQYAPWPLQSSGGVGKTGAQWRNTLLIAAGISLVVASVDMYIFKNKQKKERAKTISTPPPRNLIIETRPLREPEIYDDTEEIPIWAEIFSEADDIIEINDDSDYEMFDILYSIDDFPINTDLQTDITAE